MAMTINSLMSNPGADIYYDPDFRAVLDINMNFLRNHPKTTRIAIVARDSYKYTGDLSGLLSQYNVDVALHWVVMRMNNLLSPSAYNDSIRILLIPPADVVNRIRSLHVTQNKIKN